MGGEDEPYTRIIPPPSFKRPPCLLGADLIGQVWKIEQRVWLVHVARPALVHDIFIGVGLGRWEYPPYGIIVIEFQPVCGRLVGVEDLSEQLARYLSIDESRTYVWQVILTPGGLAMTSQ